MLAEVQPGEFLGHLVQRTSIRVGDEVRALVSVDPQALPVGMEIEASDLQAGVDPGRVEQVPHPQHGHLRAERVQRHRRRLDADGRQALARSQPDPGQFVRDAEPVLAPRSAKHSHGVAAQVRIDRLIECLCFDLGQFEIGEELGRDLPARRQVERVDT